MTVLDTPDFNKYFESQGFDEQDREMFRAVWNAAIESAGNWVIDCESYDYGLKDQLKG